MQWCILVLTALMESCGSVLTPFPSSSFSLDSIPGSVVTRKLLFSPMSQSVGRSVGATVNHHGGSDTHEEGRTDGRRGPRTNFGQMRAATAAVQVAFTPTTKQDSGTLFVNSATVILFPLFYSPLRFLCRGMPHSIQ